MANLAERSVEGRNKDLKVATWPGMLKAALFILSVGALAYAGPTGCIEGSASQSVAVYPCGPELQAALDEHGLPLYGSSAPADARKRRSLVPSSGGHFRLEGLAPGRYYVESPPLYYPGEDPIVDQIFAGGGCVYFGHRQSVVVDLQAGKVREVEFVGPK